MATNPEIIVELLFFIKDVNQTVQAEQRQGISNFHKNYLFVLILKSDLILLKSTSANSSGIGQAKNQTIFWKTVVDAKKPNFMMY